MKIREAEELVCPFISNAVNADNDQVNRWKVYCITDKCMAWETTKSDDRVTDLRYEKVKRLPREDCEGYCRR